MTDRPTPPGPDSAPDWPAEMPARVIPMARRQARLSRRAAWGGLGIAAAAAGVLGLALVQRGRARLAKAGTAVTTTIGQRDSVRLPDGSRVVLAPGSRVIVAKGYGQGARTVTLEGAALFTVRHDEKRPFTVRARNALVRDLGTAFTVHTDAVPGGPPVAGVPSGPVVTVSVTEGAVALRESGSGAAGAAAEITLRAGDRGALREGGVPVAMRGAGGADDAAWATGRIVYREVPLEQVAADLQRWYGYSVQVQSAPLAATRITATFDQSDPPSRAVDVIALALGPGVKVERHGTRGVLMYPDPIERTLPSERR